MMEEKESGVQKGLCAENARHGAEDHGGRDPESVGYVIPTNREGIVLEMRWSEKEYPWEKHICTGHFEKRSNPPERNAR